MKFAVLLSALLAVSFARAEEKIKWYFNNEDITKMVEMYSKVSGQKFVVDPGVRGKASIFIQEPVTLEEAFNQLSSALAINGYAISKQGDTMVIRSARNTQRDYIEVSSKLPNPKPERMYTWVYTAKYVPVDAINRDIRILTSKDGEMVANMTTNQLLISDYTSNLNRIADILKEIDKPVDPAVAKVVEAGKKERATRAKEREKTERAGKNAPPPPGKGAPPAPVEEN